MPNGLSVFAFLVALGDRGVPLRQGIETSDRIPYLFRASLESDRHVNTSHGVFLLEADRRRVRRYHQFLGQSLRDIPF